MFRIEDVPEIIQCKYCKKDFSRDELDKRRLMFEQLICNDCQNAFLKRVNTVIYTKKGKKYTVGDVMLMQAKEAFDGMKEKYGIE